MAPGGISIPSRAGLSISRPYLRDGRCVPRLTRTGAGGDRSDRVLRGSAASRAFLWNTPSLRRQPGTPAGGRAPPSAPPNPKSGGGEPPLPAVPPPLLFGGRKSKWRVVDSEADFPNSHLALDKTPTRIALRERWRFPPPRSGGEDWSSRSERTVVEGAPDAKTRFRCSKIFFARRSERTCPNIT